MLTVSWDGEKEKVTRIQQSIFIPGWVISSESCSFPSVCAQIFRDVMPGEIVKLEKYKMPRTLAMVPRPDGKQSQGLFDIDHSPFPPLLG